MTSLTFVATLSSDPQIYLFILLPTVIPLVISRLAAHSVARKTPESS
jgi:hypothetical protein